MVYNIPNLKQLAAETKKNGASDSKQIYDIIEGKGKEGLSELENTELRLRYSFTASAYNFMLSKEAWEAKQKKLGGKSAKDLGIDLEFFAIAADLYGANGAVDKIASYGPDTKNIQQKMLSNENGANGKPVLSYRHHHWLKRAWSVYEQVRAMGEDQIQDLLTKFDGASDKGSDLYSIIHSSLAHAVDNHREIDPAMRVMLTKIAWWCSPAAVDDGEAINRVFGRLKEDLNRYSRRPGGLVGVTEGTVSDIVSRFGTSAFQNHHESVKGEETTVERKEPAPSVAEAQTEKPSPAPVVSVDELMEMAQEKIEEWQKSQIAKLREKARQQKPIVLEKVPVPRERMAEAPVGKKPEAGAASEQEKRERQAVQLKKLMAEQKLREQEKARATLKETFGLTDEQVASLPGRELSLMISGLSALQKAEGKKHRGELTGAMKGMEFDKLMRRVISFASYDYTGPGSEKLSFKDAKKRIGEWANADKPKEAPVHAAKPEEKPEEKKEEKKEESPKGKKKKKPPKIKIPKPIEDEEIMDEPVKLATRTEKAKVMPKIDIPEPVGDEEVFDEPMTIKSKTEFAKIERTEPEAKKEEPAKKEEKPAAASLDFALLATEKLSELSASPKPSEVEAEAKTLEAGFGMLRAADENLKREGQLTSTFMALPSGKQAELLSYFGSEFKGSDYGRVEYMVNYWAKLTNSIAKGQ